MSSVLRAELHGVRRDGEVGLDADARDVGVEQADRDALRRRKRQRRRIEARMEAAHGQHEVRVVAPGDQQAQLAFERQEHDARFEQAREEIQALLVELDRADEVHLDDDQRRIVGRQRHLEHADDGDVARDLDDDADRNGDRAAACPSRASPSGR